MSEHNKAIYNTFVALLRHELSGDAFTGSIPTETAVAIMDMAKRHSLLPLVTEGILKYAVLDENSQKTLKNSRLLAVYRHEQLEQMQNAVGNLLSENEISHIFLKGTVIAKYYPQPWMRTRGDLDVLIRPKDMEQATKLLVDKLLFKVCSKNYHDVTMLSQNGRILELHFNLLEKEKKMDRVLSLAWDRARPQKEYSYEFDDEFFVFHQIAHTAYHFMNGGCGIRFLIDLWLLEKNLSLDQPKLQVLLKKAELQEFYKNIRKLILHWFEKEAPNELILQMEDYIISGSVFGTDENKIATEQNRYGGKRGYIFHRLFWSYDDLKTQFSSLEGKKYLVGVYQLRRWLRLFNPNKLHSSRKQLKINQTVDPQKASTLGKLMKKVGL